MRGYQKYRRTPVVNYPEREWPNKQIEKAPTWVSVDLRDGNQALIDPMVVSEKMDLFRLLVKLGFKQIEIGFPAASQIEYDFLRELIDKNMIPDDVLVQVLSQCREDQIQKTFESIRGCKQAVVHIYNSTSTLQRDVVFGKDKQAIIDIAVQGTKWVKERAEKFPGKILFEYSPESFTGTELDFALEICTAVQDVWQPTPEEPMIFNLPSTVELTTDDSQCLRGPDRVDEPPFQEQRQHHSECAPSQRQRMRRGSYRACSSCRRTARGGNSPRKRRENRKRRCFDSCLQHVLPGYRS